MKIYGSTQVKLKISALLLFLILSGLTFGHPGRASAAYSDLPTTIPNNTINGPLRSGDSGANKYINITDSQQTSGGTGANHPNTYLKVYTNSLTGANHLIAIRFNNIYNSQINCDGYPSKGVEWQIIGLDGNENPDFSKTYATNMFDVHYRYTNGNNCGTNWYIAIPDSAFTASNIPEHAGIYMAAVVIRIPPVTSPNPFSYFLTASTSLAGNPDTRLGYLDASNLGGTIIYPEQSGSSPYGRNTVGMPFQPKCTPDSDPSYARRYFYYGDDDYGTNNQKNSDME
jgi:hypothetical protein